jgi:heptosyltransferase-1
LHYANVQLREKRGSLHMPILKRRTEYLYPERICIIKPSALGDVVHALPVLSALRSRWPDAHITWVVSRLYEDLVRNHHDIDEVLVFDRCRRGETVPAAARVLLGLCQRLRHGRFDLAIDLQGLLRSALLAAATGAKLRVGMADAREGSRCFYTDLVDAPRQGVHAVDRALLVARVLGAVEVEPEFNIPISREDHEWAIAHLALAPRPRVMLNVGARWLTKRWPPEHFAEIGRRAAAEYGATIVASGAAGDRPLVEALRRHLGRVRLIDFCGRTRLKQLAALALECDLMVSNDTGPLHLAAAAGARVVGIYTCTSPALTGPVGPHVATVASCVWCAPSFVKKCRRLDCMSELTPDRVWPVVRDQLEQSLAGQKRETTTKNFELSSVVPVLLP